jgi:hypothetical protein
MPKTIIIMPTATSIMAMDNVFSGDFRKLLKIIVCLQSSFPDGMVEKPADLGGTRLNPIIAAAPLEDCHSEVDGDRKCEQKAAARMQANPHPRIGWVNVFPEIPQEQANHQRNVGDEEQYSALAVELLNWNTHGRGPPLGSILEAVPNKECKLDSYKKKREGKEIPAPDMVNPVAVFEEADRQAGAEDAGLA